MKCVRLLSVHNRTRCYTFPKKILLSLLTTGCGGHRKSGKATMNFTQKRGGGLVHFITSMDAGASQLTASAVHEIACLSTADEAWYCLRRVLQSVCGILQNKTNRLVFTREMWFIDWSVLTCRLTVCVCVCVGGGKEFWLRPFVAAHMLVSPQERTEHLTVLCIVYTECMHTNKHLTADKQNNTWVWYLFSSGVA